MAKMSAADKTAYRTVRRKMAGGLRGPALIQTGPTDEQGNAQYNRRLFGDADQAAANAAKYNMRKATVTTATGQVQDLKGLGGEMVPDQGVDYPGRGAPGKSARDPEAAEWEGPTGTNSEAARWNWAGHFAGVKPWDADASEREAGARLHSAVMEHMQAHGTSPTAHDDALRLIEAKGREGAAAWVAAQDAKRRGVFAKQGDTKDVGAEDIGTRGLSVDRENTANVLDYQVSQAARNAPQSRLTGVLRPKGATQSPRDPDYDPNRYQGVKAAVSGIAETKTGRSRSLSQNAIDALKASRGQGIHNAIAETLGMESPRTATPRQVRQEVGRQQTAEFATSQGYTENPVEREVTGAEKKALSVGARREKAGRRLAETTGVSIRTRNRVARGASTVPEKMASFVTRTKGDEQEVYEDTSKPVAATEEDAQEAYETERAMRLGGRASVEAQNIGGSSIGMAGVGSDYIPGPSSAASTGTKHVGKSNVTVTTPERESWPDPKAPGQFKKSLAKAPNTTKPSRAPATRTTKAARVGSAGRVPAADTVVAQRTANRVTAMARPRPTDVQEEQYLPKVARKAGSGQEDKAPASPSRMPGVKAIPLKSRRGWARQGQAERMKAVAAPAGRGGGNARTV